MKRLSSVLITSFILSLVAQGIGHAAAPAVRSSADIRNSGEITGQVSFCFGALPSTGTIVDLVSESYDATTGAE